MRLIDADELLKEAECKCNDGRCRAYNCEECLSYAVSVIDINKMPTVEQKHGHWIEIDRDVMGCKTYECSNCGKTDNDYSEPIFCKHCGSANGIARMDEVSE